MTDENERMPPYIGQDGLKRNWTRTKYEWGVFKKHWKAQPKSHDPVSNFFVEFSRSVPWLAGHAWLVNNVVWLVACLLI